MWMWMWMRQKVWLAWMKKGTKAEAVRHEEPGACAQTTELAIDKHTELAIDKFSQT